jgi:hypothetical protein
MKVQEHDKSNCDFVSMAYFGGKTNGSRPEKRALKRFMVGRIKV